jgi:hypothetical protein
MRYYSVETSGNGPRDILDAVLYKIGRLVNFKYPKFVSKYSSEDKILEYDDERFYSTPDERDITIESDNTLTHTFYVTTQSKKRRYLGILHLEATVDSEKLVSLSFRRSFMVIINPRKYPRKWLVGKIDIRIGKQGLYTFKSIRFSDLSPLMLGYITKALNETEDLNPIQKNKVIGNLIELSRNYGDRN